jgi:hypothetical protein
LSKKEVLEREEQSKVFADQRAQLETVLTEKSALKNHLLMRDDEVKKLKREANEAPKLKELDLLWSSSSKAVLEFLSSQSFQVATLMMMKLMMLNYIRTMQSYVVEFYFFQLEEFGVQETPVDPPSLDSYKWVCERDQIIFEEGVALLLHVMIWTAHKHDINTLK